MLVLLALVTEGMTPFTILPIPLLLPGRQDGHGARGDVVGAQAVNHQDNYTLRAVL